jgi:hypothetical protein
VIPRQVMPLKKASKSLALPSKFGEMLQPEKNQPPLYLASPYAMENFGEFLEAVAWCGLEYGAVQLQVPTLEEDGSWWPRTKQGTVRKTAKYVFEGRLQNLTRLVKQESDISEIFALDWVPIPKKEAINQAGFFLWEKYLTSKDTWRESDSRALWVLERYGMVNRSKLYGVDADGKYFLGKVRLKKEKLILILATLFNRTHSPLQVFKQPFNLLNVCEEKIPGIHTPYVYGGTPGTFFAWHLEDFQLYSANYQIDGAAKVWYTIPAYYLENFVQDELGKSVSYKKNCVANYILFHSSR